MSAVYGIQSIQGAFELKAIRAWVYRKVLDYIPIVSSSSS